MSSANPRNPKSAPHPGSAAGYSGTPLAKKLGIKEGHIVVLANEPEHLLDILAPLPASVSFKRKAKDADVILLFADNLKSLTTNFARLKSQLAQNGRLWACWPKKASGVKTDITSESLVQRIGLDEGLVDVKVCAIDQTWSGLCFVIRVKDRK
jgi:hypothetical protein